MDAETWNEQIRQRNAANTRGTRMGELYAALGPLAALAAELGAEGVATQLREIEAHTFLLAMQAQNHAGNLMRALEEARAAGEEPA